MDFVFGDDATRAGAKASVDGFSTENGNEEVKQPQNDKEGLDR